MPDRGLAYFLNNTATASNWGYDVFTLEPLASK
jgi:hypothetical protein